MALPPNENIATYRNSFFPAVTTVAEVLDAIIEGGAIGSSGSTSGAGAPVSYDEGDDSTNQYLVQAAAGPLYDDATIFTNGQFGVASPDDYTDWTEFAGTQDEGTVDPSDGAGVAGTVGTLYVQHADTAATFVGLFLKTGAGDTAWTDKTTVTADNATSDPVDGHAGSPQDVPPGASYRDTETNYVYVNSGTALHPIWVAGGGTNAQDVTLTITAADNTRVISDSDTDVEEALITLDSAISGIIPASPVTFTQTYSTAAATVPAAPLDTLVLTGTNIAAKTASLTLTDAVNTNAGTVATSLDQAQKDIGTALNLATADILALKKVVTQIIDILQAQGLAD